MTDTLDLTNVRNLNVPKGVIKITIEVMMPRPEKPEICDHVACEPLFINILPHKDKKNLSVEVMPKIRSIVVQMFELARSHTHAPLAPEKMIEKIEKPSGPLQAEVYRRNMVTGEMFQVGEPTLLDNNFEPIAKIEV